MGLTPFRRSSPKDNPSADFSDQLLRLPIVDGMLVEGSVVLGEATAQIRHGLGRPYRGGFIVGCTLPSPNFLFVRMPETATDTDTSRFVLISSDTTFTNSADIRLWVFLATLAFLLPNALGLVA